MGTGQVQNDFQLTRNFNLREFICPHCGAVIIHPRLVNLLQKIRDKVNKPVNVISGYRCAERNKAVVAFNLSHGRHGRRYLCKGGDWEGISRFNKCLLVREMGEWV